MINFRRVPAVLALILVMACAGPRGSGAASDGAGHASATNATKNPAPDFIGSRAELDAYLAANETTPLDALSPPAKGRFLESLEFNDGRLVGAELVGDLRSQLNREEGTQILRLFGAESYADTIYPEGHVPEPRYPTETDLEQRHAALRAAARSLRGTPSEAERSRQMVEAHDRLFPEPAAATVARGEPRDVRARLKALSLMGVYRHGDRDADEALLLLQALEGAGVVLPGDAARAQGILIQARRFEEAAELADRFFTLNDVPGIRRLDLPVERSLWAIDEGPTLIQREVPKRSGLQLIVMSHPHCHFSTQLLEAAERDEELRSLLSEALWLAPVGSDLSAGSIREWNERTPWASLQLVNAVAEWPEIQDWATPTFHFVKDGQVKETVSGWIPEKSRAELMSAAERIGLLEGASE